MTEPRYDVVVAGAGPVGLLLAAELSLAGASVVVLERLTTPNLAIKAGGINGRSTQALHRRGLRARLTEAAAEQGPGFASFAKQPASGGRFDGHFAGLFLHASPELDVPPGTVLPQQALEAVLGAWVAELGVPVLRGQEITGLTQDADGVTVETAAQLRFRGRYLAGCDGGRSTVRKLTGFAFPGTEPLTTGYQSIVELAGPDRLPLGWHLTANGLCAHGPKAGRLLTVAFDGPPHDREAEITLAEIQDNLRHVSGIDVTVTALHAATRYTDNARQATTYRDGRVLLAGDAAHVHPPFGGQGLNLGLQDAANLSWKLAAVATGRAPESLLDTYTRERHPVAARVLENTRAQVGLMRPDPHSRAMRDVLADLIATTDVDDRLVATMQGLDIRYDVPTPCPHPLAGRHVPDLPGLDDAMRLPRPVLVEFTGSALHDAVREWDIGHLSLPRTGELTALLVRPDGYVAWATDDVDPDLDTLREALLAWAGVGGAVR